MKKNLLKVGLLVSLLCVSCEETFLGEGVNDNPVNNFEIFWNDLDSHYGLFYARRFNWDSIYNVYKPQVTMQTSRDELWEIFKGMIAYLDDSHTFIKDPYLKRQFSSGEENFNQISEEFSTEVIKSNYLKFNEVISGAGLDGVGDYFYGAMGQDIGYIYLNGIEAENDAFMDLVLREIGDKKAIILDLRNNFGGDDITAQEIAGRFADGGQFIYSVQERNGSEHDDFSTKRRYYAQKKGKEHFSKPLVVLTNGITVSAAEILMLHLKSFGQVTHIGGVTAGDFSDASMRRFLPNGWQYQYSIMMYLLPNGESLDGKGHKPNIEVRNSVSEIKEGRDSVLERAVEFLSENYNIN